MSPLKKGKGPFTARFSKIIQAPRGRSISRKLTTGQQNSWLPIKNKPYPLHLLPPPIRHSQLTLKKRSRSSKPRRKSRWRILTLPRLEPLNYRNPRRSRSLRLERNTYSSTTRMIIESSKNFSRKEKKRRKKLRPFNKGRKKTKWRSALSHRK